MRKLQTGHLWPLTRIARQYQLGQVVQLGIHLVHRANYFLLLFGHLALEEHIKKQIEANFTIYDVPTRNFHISSCGLCGKNTNLSIPYKTIKINPLGRLFTITVKFGK